MALCQRAFAGLVIALILLGLLVPLWDGHLPSVESKASSPRLAPVSGPQKTIVILVNFTDMPGSVTRSQVVATLDSMNDYYAENSYGLVNFQTDFTPSPSVGWYEMPNTMAYYGADSPSSNNQLVRDALQAANNAGIDVASYKFAIVVHSGNDQAKTQVPSDIHSYTIPDFPFSLLVRISTSVVAETDPMGVVAHESGHLLGLPDLYDTTGQIDPNNNFVGSWELMGLGEWNPNTGFPPEPGTYPSHMSSWSKIDLGFVPSGRIFTIQSGESANVTVENLELPTTGFQVVKIPLAFNPDGSMTYYLVEMRAKQGTYDQYLPFPATYPDAGLLIYKVDESIPDGQGSVRLVDAHPGGDMNDAPFGPCSLTCVSNNTFWDQANFVKVIVLNTSTTAYTISVDRTDSPPFLLQVNTPASGVLVSVDGVNMTSDASKQLRITVRYGPHTVYVESRIPISIGSTIVQLGLTNAFVGWDDGGTSNPRGISVVQDTVLTAVYQIIVEPPFTLAVAAIVILPATVLTVTLYRRRKKAPTGTLATLPPNPPSVDAIAGRTGTGLLPRNDSLPDEPVEKDENAEGSKT